MKKETLLGYVSTRVLDTPFWGLYNLMPFILYKDLNGTPFQVALLIMLKPMVSLLSMYWASHVHGRPDRLIKNILWGRILGYFPFFLVPWIHSSWYFIAIYGTFMLFTVGIVPAWMELLKKNLPDKTREKTFAYTQAFGYMGGGLFPFLIGGLLDGYTDAWRWLFPVAALIGFSAVLFQSRMRIEKGGEELTPEIKGFQKVKHPWIQSWKLLKEQVDFRRFQIGFTFVGAGLMVIQPALPVFFVDTLNLSYTELAVAVTLCKGIGFAVGTPGWTHLLGRLGIFLFSGGIAALAALFPFILLSARYEMWLLWVAYFIYGFAQAGSELAWNMSGPIFSGKKESSLYSSINVVMVGLRGAVVPTLGSMLIYMTSSSATMAIGGGLCLIGGLSLSYFANRSDGIPLAADKTV